MQGPAHLGAVRCYQVVVRFFVAAWVRVRPKLALDSQSARSPQQGVSLLAPTGGVPTRPNGGVLALIFRVIVIRGRWLGI